MGRQRRGKRTKPGAPASASARGRKSERAPEGKPKQGFDLRQRWHVLVGIASATIIALVVVGVAVSSFLPSPRGKVLPPTTIAGHVESYPEERISRERPIPLPVQRHILEHVPLSLGGERPGILLQFNCEKFACEGDLVDRLVTIAERYEYVYLAPYPEMEAKIALTAYGRILTLDEVDEGRIQRFIEGR